MRKLSFLVCGFAFILTTFFGCDNPGKESLGSEVSETKVWTAYSTQKVLQNRQDLYPETKRGTMLTLLAAKGEYESGQIILSAGGKDEKYTLEVSDLICGNSVFSRENISVYHEKYVEVAKNYENTSAPAGMYPDALLPYETAVQKKENKVSAGENQGVYLTFHIPRDQVEGIYRGTVEVTISGEITSVPVFLEVCGFEISEKVNSKSIFLTQWYYQSGELDSTQEILDAYTEKLIEYRLAPQYVVIDSAFTDEDIEYYVEKAAKYLVDPACSNISVPYATTMINGETCIDPDIFSKYLHKFAEKSFELNFNLCEKLTCYFNIIDEPHITGATERVKVVLTEFKKVLEKVATEIESSDATNTLKGEIATSIREIKSVVTTSYDESLANYVDTWCPTVDNYDYLSELYEDQEEKWWYTCNNPKVPYPTFHTEDTLLSARIMGWMMTEYDIVGNLYWATNIYASYEDGSYKPLDDYFSSASRFPNVNGDGYLFYPGGQYGLNSPLASVRLEALRDGLEEFEIGYYLKNAYAQLPNANAENALDGIYENITSSLYSGTQVAAAEEAFIAARENLYRLAELASSEANVCFTSFKDDRYGKLEYEIYAKEGYVLKNNGIALTPSDNRNGYNIYRLVFDLSKGENRISVSVECGGKEYSFEKYLGGRIEKYDAESFAGGFTRLDGASVSVTATDALDGSLGKWLNFEIGVAPENKWQNFKWTDEKISALDGSIQRVVLHLYYNGDTPLPITISAKYAKNNILSDMVNFTLKKGMNAIEISNLEAYNWERTGKIEYLAFYLGGKKGNAANSDIWLADMVVYGV